MQGVCTVVYTGREYKGQSLSLCLKIVCLMALFLVPLSIAGTIVGQISIHLRRDLLSLCQNIIKLCSTQTRFRAGDPHRRCLVI